MNVPSFAASLPSAEPTPRAQHNVQPNAGPDGSGSSFAHTLQHAIASPPESPDTPKRTAAVPENKAQKKITTRPATTDAKENTAYDAVELSVAATTAPAEKATSNLPETAAKQTSEVATTATVTGSTVSAADSGELALAMSISGDSSSDSAVAATSIGSAQGNSWLSSAASHPGVVPPIASAETQHKLETTDTQTSGGDSGSTETHLAGNASSMGNSKQTSASAPTDFEAEFAKFRGEAVKSAHVQISNENNTRVDIRMVERGGSLSVSVRSTDSALTKALGDHATDLTSRLSLDHYKTETWTPGASKNFSERQGTPFQGGGRDGGPADQGKRQNSKQNQDPEWVQEFENTPGAFQKRINYTWPQ